MDELVALVCGDGDAPAPPRTGRTPPTAGGTEWFLTLTDASWRLNYVQTW